MIAWAMGAWAAEVRVEGEPDAGFEEAIRRAGEDVAAEARLTGVHRVVVLVEEGIPEEAVDILRGSVRVGLGEGSRDEVLGLAAARMGELWASARGGGLWPGLRPEIGGFGPGGALEVSGATVGRPGLERVWARAIGEIWAARSGWIQALSPLGAWIRDNEASSGMDIAECVLQGAAARPWSPVEGLARGCGAEGLPPEGSPRSTSREGTKGEPVQGPLGVVVSPSLWVDGRESAGLWAGVGLSVGQSPRGLRLEARGRGGGGWFAEGGLSWGARGVRVAGWAKGGDDRIRELGLVDGAGRLEVGEASVLGLEGRSWSLKSETDFLRSSRGTVTGRTGAERGPWSWSLGGSAGWTTSRGRSGAESWGLGEAELVVRWAPERWAIEGGVVVWGMGPNSPQAERIGVGGWSEEWLPSEVGGRVTAPGLRSWSLAPDGGSMLRLEGRSLGPRTAPWVGEVRADLGLVSLEGVAGAVVSGSGRVGFAPRILGVHQGPWAGLALGWAPTETRFDPLRPLERGAVGGPRVGLGWWVWPETRDRPRSAERARR